MVFLDPKFPFIQERLRPDSFDPEASPNAPDLRVDRIENFFYLSAMKWKDSLHEYKIMGNFIEVIMKSFDFKMEFSIHECIKHQEEICLVQVGFLEDEENKTDSCILVYLSNDFDNQAISCFISNFFKKRDLRFKKKRNKPEEFRLEDFLHEDRGDARLYGLFLYVDRSKFLNQNQNLEDDGITVLQRLMQEFYDELDQLFEDRNTFLRYLRAQEKRAQAELGGPEAQYKSQLDIGYLKSRGEQFFVKWDSYGAEILDFVHLRIWHDTSKDDLITVIVRHLPGLEFEFADCTEEEYEMQKDRLSYVL
jgi:hypothetical protein